MLKKVACNATNSAAIDVEGNLFVWGSTRYGLCGTQDPSSNAKAAAAKKDGDGNSKGFAIPTPVKLPLLQTDHLSSLDQKHTLIGGR